jgi:hypothetical protein
VLWNIPLTLDVNEIKFSNRLSIFPNPSSQRLNIQLSSVPKNEQLILYNELGQLQKIYSNINSRTASFDITSFSNGQYMAVLRDGDRTIATKFLITK